MDYMIFEILVFPGFLFVVTMSLLIIGVLRKLAARMQSRIGPPIVQPFYDAIKLFSKEDVRPNNSGIGFYFWPMVALVAAVTCALMVPMGGEAVLEPYSDFIVIVYFLAMATFASYMAGFSSSNPFGMIGAIRGFMQLIMYELALVIALFVPMIAVSTVGGDFLSISALVGFEQSNYLMIFAYPLAGIAFFFALLGKTEIPPFHAPNSHQELAGGYTADFSGPALGMIEVAHAVKVFVAISLFVNVFLGGAAGIAMFILKVFFVLLVVSLFRIGMARYRIDHVIEFYVIISIIASIDLIRVLLLPYGV